MGLVKRKIFIKQYLKRLKELLERYLPEADEEVQMVKITKLIETGEIRHIDDVISHTKGEGNGN